MLDTLSSTLTDSSGALVFRYTYTAKHIKTGKYTTFEHHTVSLQHGENTLHVTTVYVPSRTFSSDFNDQFSELTGVLLSLSGKHVIVSDFNFRINESADVNAANFKALIEQFNLIQHVNLSTHVAGNALDLILTCDDMSVTHIHTDHSVNSDHCAVLFNLSCASPGTVRKSITYRNGNLLTSRLYNLIYLGLSLIFHLMIWALLLDFIMIL